MGLVSSSQEGQDVMVSTLIIPFSARQLLNLDEKDSFDGKIKELVNSWSTRSIAQSTPLNTTKNKSHLSEEHEESNNDLKTIEEYVFKLLPADSVELTHVIDRIITSVGIYLGNGSFINSSSSKGVTISDINDPYYWKSKFFYGTRIFN